MKLTRNDLDETLFFVNCNMDKYNQKKMGYSYIPGEKKGYCIQVQGTTKQGIPNWEITDTDMTLKEIWSYFSGINLGFLIAGKGVQP